MSWHADQNTSNDDILKEVRSCLLELPPFDEDPDAPLSEREELILEVAVQEAIRCAEERASRRVAIAVFG
jgi:hypothetical protein